MKLRKEVAVLFEVYDDGKKIFTITETLFYCIYIYKYKFMFLLN